MEIYTVEKATALLTYVRVIDGEFSGSSYQRTFEAALKKALENLEKDRALGSREISSTVCRCEFCDYHRRIVGENEKIMKNS